MYLSIKNKSSAHNVKLDKNHCIIHIPMGQNYRWELLLSQKLEVVEQAVQASLTYENCSAVGSPFVVYAVHHLCVL